MWTIWPGPWPVVFRCWALAMTDAIPAREVVQMPGTERAALAPRRHVFDPQEKWVPAHRTPTRLNQTERTCTLCGVVKVTVHEEGGAARREWRASEHGVQGEAEIVCAGMVGKREMDSTT